MAALLRGSCSHDATGAFVQMRPSSSKSLGDGIVRSGAHAPIWHGMNCRGNLGNGPTTMTEVRGSLRGTNAAARRAILQAMSARSSEGGIGLFDSTRALSTPGAQRVGARAEGQRLIGDPVAGAIARERA